MEVMLMSKFLTKLQICLTEPRKIGFFMGEKKWKTLLQLFILTFLALTPFLIRLSVKDGISNESKEYLEEVLMSSKFKGDVALIDGLLVGNQAIAIEVTEGIIFINPKGETLENNSNYPVFELANLGVNVYVQGSLIYSATYAELGYLDINFRQIFKSNYLEFNVLVSLINKVFVDTNSFWVSMDYFATLVGSYISLILCALILALIVGIGNNRIAFKFRFKGALDAQFISVLFLGLAHLFNAAYLEIIGLCLSSFYLIRALSSIVRIEVRKIKKESEGK
jgi:hypothetical protein